MSVYYSDGDGWGVRCYWLFADDIALLHHLRERVEYGQRGIGMHPMFMPQVRYEPEPIEPHGTISLEL